MEKRGRLSTNQRLRLQTDRVKKDFKTKQEKKVCKALQCLLHLKLHKPRINNVLFDFPLRLSLFVPCGETRGERMSADLYADISKNNQRSLVQIQQ